ncbi:MAG: hypothetical protein K9N40_09865 [Candidatus Cloacimonetes bacterium]|nr:hypothetical protein [Candidatus Cloacimonadota bacterium]
MKKTILVLLIIATALQLAAIFDDYEPSPRARGMGGAFYATSDDANAVFYNPAGLVNSPNNILVGYTQLFGCDFAEVSSFAFGLKLPGKFGRIGFGLLSLDAEYLGVNLLSEKNYVVSHGMNILKDIHSSLDFGYSLNMYSLKIDGFGSQSVLGINAGLLATLHQRTRIGFTVYNLNNPAVGTGNDHELPQRIAMGISYSPYADVTTNLELKKAIDGDTEIHTGSEVKVLDMLILRLGLRTNPKSFSAGARFDMFNVLIDYAVNTHTMGLTHHFGVGYKF